MSAAVTTPATLRTEHAFTLPRGYLGPDGTVHRDGIMRLATARDPHVLLPRTGYQGFRRKSVTCR